MEPVSATLLYLASFRIGMIAAGIVSIVLGYRLLVLGVRANQAADREEQVSGEFAGFKLTLSNVTPGSAFALFGVVVLGLQLIEGRPEAALDFLEDGVLSRAEFRGGDANSLPEANEGAPVARAAEDALRELERHPDRAKDITLETLKPLASNFNDMAWVLAKADPEAPQARPLAELALTLNPSDPNTIHTLAEIEYSAGNPEKAIELLEGAANAQSSAFKEQLDRWRSELGGP